MRVLSFLVTAALFTVNPLFAGEERRAPVSKASAFLPFDFYSRNRDDLGLSADQAREVDRLAKEMREPAQKLESERSRRTKALMEAMSANPVNTEEAMARFQAVLETENELKALQFRSAIAARNALTSDQVRKLEQLALKDGGSRLSPARTALNERIQQLRTEIQKRSGGEPPKAVLRQLKEIEQAAREGRSGEAKDQLEQLLKQLRQEAEPPAQIAAPAANPELPR